MNPRTTVPCVAGLVLGAVMLATRQARAEGPKLLVFVQTAVKQRALQAMLQGALPGLTVSTVGRVADFDRGLQEGQDAVLTLPIVLQAHNITPQVRGHRGGATDERYSLVGADAPPVAAAVKTVGALDLLGRDATNAFVQGLVGNHVKVERVTKVEDLLPLLQMQRADAVLLPSRMFGELKASSSLNLAQAELPQGVGLPAVASVGAAGGPAVDAVRKLGGDVASVLGVDGWQ